VRAGPTEPYNPLLMPPWEPRADRNNTRIGYVPGLATEEAAASFRNWAAAINQREIIIYTNGSKISRAAGAGWAICQGPGHPIVSRGRQPLPYAEVFDAEVVAALRGLQEACSSIRAEFATDIYICLDNLEVARSLTFQTKTSSQGIFSAFAKAAQH
jgi:hypothetical protein